LLSWWRNKRKKLLDRRTVYAAPVCSHFLTLPIASQAIRSHQKICLHKNS
jgi:hypothetical protein